MGTKDVAPSWIDVKIERLLRSSKGGKIVGLGELHNVIKAGFVKEDSKMGQKF